MANCELGHKNAEESEYCSECNFPLRVSDEEKISYLKSKTDGVILYEMNENSLDILDLTNITHLNSDISLLFPNLRNLKLKVERRINLDFLPDFTSLQYLTLNLKVIGNKARLNHEIVEYLPKNITSLTITVDEYEMDDSFVDISEHLLDSVPNLNNLYIYCNPSSIDFLSKGHLNLDLIEFMGVSFDFIGSIMNFPSLTSIRVDFAVSRIDLELRNLPNLDKLIITLSNTNNPVLIRSSNADYDLELNFDH
jgi:hypothetical protein